MEASADAENSYTSQKSNEHPPEDLDELYESDAYTKPVKNERRSRVTKEDILEDMFNDLDETLQLTVQPTVAPAPAKSTAKTPAKKRGGKVAPVPVESTSSAASRPKMIHTQKTRVQVDDGKRKSRTLITRSAQQAEPSPPPPPPASTVSTAKRPRRSTARQAAKADDTEAPVSPTKQTRSSIKVERIQNEFSEANLLRELSQKSLNYSPDVVSDLEEILRSPIKSKDSMDDQVPEESYIAIEALPARNTRVSKRISNRNSGGHSDATRQTPVRSSARIAKASSTTDDELINSIVMNIKHEKEESYTMTSDEFFTCEMCSAVFRDRAQLLVHVPIHI